jgi:hypothetical protein
MHAVSTQGGVYELGIVPKGMMASKVWHPYHYEYIGP